MMAGAVEQRHGVVCFILAEGRLYAATRACGRDLRGLVQVGLRAVKDARDTHDQVASVLSSLACSRAGLLKVGHERQFFECNEVHVDLITWKVAEVEIIVEGDETREVVVTECGLTSFAEGFLPTSFHDVGPGIPR